MLRYAADRRSIAFVCVYFAMVAAGYLLALPVWAQVALCIVTCLQSFFCAVITHNTVHAPVFEKRWQNRIFQVLLSLTYGHPVSAYVPGHNLSHHQNTQTPKDIMRTSKLRFRWNLLNQLLFSVVIGPAIFKANATYVRAMYKQRPVWFRQFVIEAIFYLGYLGLALFLDWQKFLIFVMLPHQYAAWGIMGINFVQHDGCDPNSPWNHSRNVHGKLVNWFTFNNGYHGMHHIRPALHWSLLPEAHAKELRPHLHPALDQPSLLAYVFKAYIWPGRRVTFDGQELVLDPAVPDEPWIPGMSEQPQEASLGAMS